MVHITGPRDASERLKSYWTSIGVTAALLCSMAFSGLFTGPIDHDSQGVIAELYVLCMGASFLCSLAATIMATLLHSRLNGLPRDVDLKWFIMEFHDHHLMPTRFFQAGCFFIILAVLFGIHSLYPVRTAAILWMLGAILIVGTYLGYANVQAKTKLRLSKAISNTAQLRTVFKKIDSDSGGTLDVEELQTALRSEPQLAKFLGVTAKHVEKVFDRIDDDGGGEISWEEFKVYFGR
eukprot:TRINITY_DN44578_c0_g1_i3.p1 TRINITY_DN44578_c0_g1~~TRINITY_DN44578_c0_g1_i3.p1  ORF type:complete len:236 (+),score=46.81 TRINITY_DN44578_c0_g1_i3:112-819(+)